MKLTIINKSASVPVELPDSSVLPPSGSITRDFDGALISVFRDNAVCVGLNTRMGRSYSEAKQLKAMQLASVVDFLISSAPESEAQFVNEHFFGTISNGDEKFFFFPFYVKIVGLALIVETGSNGDFTATLKNGANAVVLVEFDETAAPGDIFHSENVDLNHAVFYPGTKFSITGLDEGLAPSGVVRCMVIYKKFFGA